MNVAKRLKAAIAAHQKGRHIVAADAYRDVLRAEPENADALHFFGVLMHQIGDAEKGVAAVRKSISINPNNAAAQCNLGNMLLTARKPGDAAEAYKAALAIDPLHAETYRNFGVLLRRIGKIPEAIETLEQAADLDPDNAEVWHNLGVSYLATDDLENAARAFEKCTEQGLHREMSAVWHARILCALGRDDVALRHLQRHLQRDPNDAVALHHVDAIQGTTGDKVPEAYVREHFDSFARSFDDVLGSLDYRAPQLVAEQLDAWRGDTAAVARALDLGCGTGLCGPLIARHCEFLIGIDLSPMMLKKAVAVGAYHELHEEDLVRYLETVDDDSVGLAISADTLNYIGDLAPLMKQLARTLTPGGVLIATFEDGGEDVPAPGYALQNHGRYSHARSYLAQAISSAGLRLADTREAVLRRESAKDVHGLILTVTRPDA